MSYKFSQALEWNVHRWAHLLTQQISVTVYSLPTKENKPPFAFAANKGKFADPFAANKRFSVSSIF
jgi:hypothetical protein